MSVLAAGMAVSLLAGCGSRLERDEILANGSPGGTVAGPVQQGTTTDPVTGVEVPITTTDPVTGDPVTSDPVTGAPVTGSDPVSGAPAAGSDPV
ncbi:MAG: hypothetical protein JWN08_918, partial [Frankiales bacterium]|nr:hypothetical protein [Frankiales bacterium]